MGQDADIAAKVTEAIGSELLRQHVAQSLEHLEANFTHTLGLAHQRFLRLEQRLDALEEAIAAEEKRRGGPPATDGTPP